MVLQVNKKVFVLLLTTAYLFVTLTHILFVQPIHSSSTQIAYRYNSIFKRQSSDGVNSPVMYLIKRTDKILSKGNKYITALIVSHARSFMLLMMPRLSLISAVPAFFDLFIYSGISPHILRCLRIWPATLYLLLILVISLMGNNSFT